MSELLYQVKLASKRPAAKLIFWLLLGMILMHYLTVVSALWGADTVNLYEPMKLRLLADTTSSITLRLIQFYPLLVVIPTGFSYMEDRDNHTDIYIRARIGNKKYVRNKIAASFGVSFLVFSIPFFIEIILFGTAFPLSQTGDITNTSDYEVVVQEMISRYLFKNVYETHPVLYAFLNVGLWGLTAGTLGCLSTCISMMGIQLRALLFLPVYVLLYAVSALENILLTPYTTNYMWYVINYDTSVKSDMAVPVFNAVILAVCVVITVIMMRRDCRR